MNVSMKDVNTLINKVDALEILVVRYHERFVSIHSRLQYLEKQTHFMKLESLSMRFKNRKAAQFPPCQWSISTLSRSVYNPYNGQLLNGSNSKYNRQSYSPTCTSQQNMLRCNEQLQLIQQEQYSCTFDHIVKAQSVPALQKQPPTQPPPQPSPQPSPQPAPQPASQPAQQPAPQPALQPAPQPAPQSAPQPALYNKPHNQLHNQLYDQLHKQYHDQCHNQLYN